MVVILWKILSLPYNKWYKKSKIKSTPSINTNRLKQYLTSKINKTSLLLTSSDKKSKSTKRTNKIYKFNLNILKNKFKILKDNQILKIVMKLISINNKFQI